MNERELRSKVADFYDGPAWKARVYRMPINQVYAIYRSRDKKKVINTVEPKPHQISIWEWANECAKKGDKNEQF